MVGIREQRPKYRVNNTQIIDRSSSFSLKDQEPRQVIFSNIVNFVLEMVLPCIAPESHFDIKRQSQSKLRDTRMHQ